MNRAFRWLRTWLLAGLPVAALGFGYCTLYIPNSAGFQAASAAVAKIPDVQARVGKVQGIEVLPFQPFRERFVGSERFVLLSLRVRGDAGEMKMRINLASRDGQWKVEDWQVLDR